MAKKVETPQAPSTKRVEIASEPTGIPVGRSPALWDSAKKIEIVSEPAGARIEVNDDYVGDAPITVAIPDSNGQFIRDTVIRALPTEGGDYTQQKSFFGKVEKPYYQRDGDQIPSRILFDMHLGPVRPSVDVNVAPAN